MDKLLYSKIISIGFRMASDLGLTPTEQASLFGQSIAADAELDALKERMAANQSAEVEERVRSLLWIMTVLHEIFGGDTDAMRRWLATKQEALGGVVPRNLLVAGDLQGVDNILRRITG